MWNLGVIAVLVFLLSARLILVAAHLRDFLGHPLWMLGLTTIRGPWITLAAAVVAGLAALLYLGTHGLHLRSVLDCYAPGVALAAALFSAGDLLSGSGYGRPAGWGLVFHSLQAQRWAGTPLGVPLYPVQLFEFATELALCAGLLAYLESTRLHRTRQPGSAAALWLAGYGVSHFAFSLLRGDLGTALLPPAQMASLAALAGSAVLLLSNRDTYASAGPSGRSSA